MPSMEGSAGGEQDRQRSAREVSVSRTQPTTPAPYSDDNQSEMLSLHWRSCTLLVVAGGHPHGMLPC
jgi:hypothetical protein